MTNDECEPGAVAGSPEPVAGKDAEAALEVRFMVGQPSRDAASVHVLVAISKLLERRYGNKLIDQDALNKLVASVALLETFWKSLLPVPKMKKTRFRKTAE